MSMFTKGFWQDAAERAAWTFAQTLGALLTVDVVAGAGFFEVDWRAALSVALLAMVYAVVKAVGAGASKPDTGASTGTAIPRQSVAAVEADHEGMYEAEEASPYADGTPVDVVPEHNDHLDHDRY